MFSRSRVLAFSRSRVLAERYAVGLVLAGLIPGGSSVAATGVKLNVAEQAAAADVIVDGTVSRVDTKVLEDGFTATLVRIDVKTVLRGSVPTGKLTLGLPGAWVDGKWVGVLGIAPVVTPGEELVFFGRTVNPTDVMMLAGMSSVFERSSTALGDIAADFDGNPVIDAGCIEDRLIARPLSEAPVSESEADGLGVVLAGTPDRAFLEDPTEAGVRWDDFLAGLAVCIEGQPAAAGTLEDVGGGW